MNSLHSWFPVDKLKIKYLCKNPHPQAIQILEKIYENNPDSFLLNWNELCSNPSAIHLLEQEYTKEPFSKFLNWTFLSRNTSAIPLLFSDTNSRYNIDWFELWGNPSAIEILENKNTRKYHTVETKQLSKNPKGIPLLLEIQKGYPYCVIDWVNLSSNPCYEAIDLLKNNPDKICWNHLSANPYAMELITEELEKNPKNIKWKNLSSNPSAIHLLYEESRRTPNRLDWNNLCKNPNAIQILLENTEKINWFCLSTNPSIFCNEYDIK